MKQITVKIKTVYGLETVYPVCPAAKLFTQIAGTKTMTRNTLRDIKTLGYSIAVEQESLPEYLQEA